MQEKNLIYSLTHYTSFSFSSVFDVVFCFIHESGVSADKMSGNLKLSSMTVEEGVHHASCQSIVDARGSVIQTSADKQRLEKGGIGI